MSDMFETLEQEEMWYGEDGYPYRVAEMEQSHRHNVLRFLRRRAKNLYMRKEWREFRDLLDAPDDVVNSFIQESARSIRCDPLEWLNSRPLVRSLERHIRLHDAINPDAFELPEGSVKT